MSKNRQELIRIYVDENFEAIKNKEEGAADAAIAYAKEVMGPDATTVLYYELFDRYCREV
tara:strand:- start:1218 stop:1397 length:180 start_codon:yes stop_codon:yes gene_type:complete